MTEEDKLKTRIAAANEAESFLNHRLYTNAKIAIRAELVRQFEKTNYTQSDERDEIWRKMQSLDWIERTMSKVVRDGKVAEKTLLEKIKSKFTGE